MNLLLIGDVMGGSGRKMVSKHVRALREARKIEFVSANVENLAGGFGVNEATLKELQDAGVDAFTSGNHIWDKKEVEGCWSRFPTLLRPLNYPPGVPGRGEALFTTASGDTVGILNLMGRAFMGDPVDDPFQASRQACMRLRTQGAHILVVDVHAEATSEKVSLWRHLDGDCTVLFGTHTHVPTADARISTRGTAYISDLGLTGGYGGVIGVTAGPIMKKFQTGIKQKMEVCEEEPEFWALYVEADVKTGRATKVEQIHLT